MDSRPRPGDGWGQEARLTSLLRAFYDLLWLFSPTPEAVRERKRQAVTPGKAWLDHHG